MGAALPRDCQEDKCGWWNDSECAIVSLARGTSLLIGAKQGISGSRVEDEQWKICPQCGSRNTSKFKFCVKCGKAL